MSSQRASPFGVGEALPWFRAATLNGSPEYSFDVAAGRPILMLLVGTGAHPQAAAALQLVQANRDLFNDLDASFFGVTVDRSDAESGRVSQQLPGIRWFLDYDRAVSSALGAGSDDSDGYQAHWLLLDRRLRVVGVHPLSQGEAAIAAFRALVAAPVTPDWAPVVMVPDVLEPELCRRLIDLYEADGGTESGFMRDVDGVTQLLVDPSHKVRRDYVIRETELARQLNLRIIARLLPMVRRSFEFEATRVERLLVGCYEAESGGHFRVHRDNTTLATAHRKFAVTINLNAGEYEGGDLMFPEFGTRTYRAPTGGAVVFSCSLLHQAMPITKGRRFAFLPFLYDEAGAKLREENARLLEGELSTYEAKNDIAV